MYMEAVAYSEISEEDGHVCSSAAFRQTAKCGTCTPEVCLILGMHACPAPQPFHARLVGAMTIIFENTCLTNVIFSNPTKTNLKNTQTSSIYETMQHKHAHRALLCA